MTLLSVFVQRPVASVLLGIAIVLLGILAYLRLPVAALPQADIPTIVVRANLPGASPESMSATVATPLERAMMGVSGVKAINSSSNQSSTQVVLHFDLNTESKSDFLFGTQLKTTFSSKAIRNRIQSITAEFGTDQWCR